MEGVTVRVTPARDEGRGLPVFSDVGPLLVVRPLPVNGSAGQTRSLQKDAIHGSIAAFVNDLRAILAITLVPAPKASGGPCPLRAIAPSGHSVGLRLSPLLEGVTRPAEGVHPRLGLRAGDRSRDWEGRCQVEAMGSLI